MPKAALGVVKAYQEGSAEDKKRIVDGLPYHTGRLKPPAQHRFKKGNKAGRGRPRGRKNLKTQLQNAMDLKVTITKNGRTKKMAASEASLHQLAAQSAQGDKKAIALMFDLARKEGLQGGEIAPTPEPMFSEDDVVIWRQLSAQLGESAAVADDRDEPEDGK
jgi:hypothetical protein